jgi:hypothetical protein
MRYHPNVLTGADLWYMSALKGLTDLFRHDFSAWSQLHSLPLRNIIPPNDPAKKQSCRHDMSQAYCNKSVGEPS